MARFEKGLKLPDLKPNRRSDSFNESGARAEASFRRLRKSRKCCSKKTSPGLIVILIDVNLLVYVGSPESPEHDRAVEWFEERMNSGERVGLPWHSLFGFLRVATKRSVSSQSLAMDEALLFVEEWLDWDTVWVPEPTVEHMKIVRNLLSAVPRSAVVPDAHLAALAIEHGLTLCSNDADFRLFPELRLHNPLE
jgi:toxin-antitoxin system PIN domain toxin